MLAPSGRRARSQPARHPFWLRGATLLVTLLMSAWLISSMGGAPPAAAARCWCSSTCRTGQASCAGSGTGCSERRLPGPTDPEPCPTGPRRRVGPRPLRRAASAASPSRRRSAGPARRRRRSGPTSGTARRSAGSARAGAPPPRSRRCAPVRRTPLPARARSRAIRRPSRTPGAAARAVDLYAVLPGDPLEGVPDERAQVRRDRRPAHRAAAQPPLAGGEPEPDQPVRPGLGARPRPRRARAARRRACARSWPRPSPCRRRAGPRWSGARRAGRTRAGAARSAAR